MKRRPPRWPVVLWVLGGLVLLTVSVLVILPPLLSADYHRAAIEALASRLTGRQVIIKGRISLSMVPAPQLRAADIRIDVPHGERISAASLRLDLAPRALLLGRLRATRLTLHQPRIVIPWPLPNGAASILPPRWLASLHARVENGTIILGGLVLDHADLTVFTGGRNAVLAASGQGMLLGMPVTASLNLGGPNGQGLAPVIASVETPVSALAQQKAGLSFSGTVNAQSLLTGRLAGSALPALTQSLPLGHLLPPAPVQFTANASASRKMITLSAMRLTAGAAQLQGSAAIDLTTGMPSLALRGNGIDATPLIRLFGHGPPHWTVDLRADLTGSRLGGFTLANLSTDIHARPGSTEIRAFSAALPGRGRLGFKGRIGAPGLHGSFTLADQDPKALIAAAAGMLPALAKLPPLAEPFQVQGSVDMRGPAPGRRLAIRLGGLQGSVEGDGDGGATAVRPPPDASLATGAINAALSGQGKARRLDIAASLGFARLDASRLADFIEAPPPRIDGLRLDLRLTAQRARIGSVQARRLLLDARLGRRLNIRTLDFYAIAHGRRAAMVALRGMRDATGMVSGASLLVSGPDAAQALPLLTGTLPAALSGPLQAQNLLKAPFTASLSASGRVDALDTRVAVNLGAMRLRAAPKLDLANNTASGTVSFRMPDAIALVKPWDGQAGLAWPGPGSVGLRADFTLAPRHLGLPNFVLSFGALTTSGRLALDCTSRPCRLGGVLNADTLALPPAPVLLSLAGAAAPIRLQLAEIKASHVLVGTLEVAADAEARLATTPQAVSLDLGHAGIAGGVLSGQAVLNAAAGATPPLLKAGLTLANADAAALQPALAAAQVPPLVSAGKLTIGLNAAASGYTAKTWAATLAGTMTASGTGLVVQGVDLAALGGSGAAPLQQAVLSGSTNFATMALNGSFANGAFTIGTARLDGAAGSASLTGTVDLPDRSLAVTASLQPRSASGQPPPFKIALSGPWAKPHRVADRADVAPP